MHFNCRGANQIGKLINRKRSPSDFSAAPHRSVRAFTSGWSAVLGPRQCRCAHFNIPQKRKNRTRPIRERRGRRREIRNPIQAGRAPFHCKCGRGHSQFQKVQVSYIRVWRDWGPSCSPSCEAHARAGPPVINTDLLEIPAEPRHCRQRVGGLGVGGGVVEWWSGSKLRSGPFNKQ